jgi:hypothetical protein
MRDSQGMLSRNTKHQHMEKEKPEVGKFRKDDE